MLQLEDDAFLDLATALVTSLIILAVIIATLRVYMKQKKRLLLYFLSSWLSFGLLTVALALSSVVESVEIFVFAYTFLAPCFVLFWFFFIDEAMNEQIGLKKTVLACVVCTISSTYTFFASWQFTGAIEITGSPFTTGNPTSDLLFLQITNVVFSLNSIAFAYWASMTYRKAPATMKSPARALFLLGMFILVGMVIQFSGDEILLVIQALINITVAIGTLVLIKKHPRIASLLPYTVYKLVIASKNGPVYYTKSWAPADVDEMMLSGIMSAIGSAVKGTIQKHIDAGAISELKMTKALMLTEMKYSCVNILLLASKASSALKKALAEFSGEFTKRFYNALYDVEGFPLEVVDPCGTFDDAVMTELIGKHFSNIPSFSEEPTVECAPSG